ncbi:MULTISPECIES: lysophospholipid acyltransferase family protein [Mycobacterium]|uniref:Phosphatidylinositol mannoside acyltransferase n=1 Tax=Mycobacterium kiyosense TaxID=2871094 RepID=A0A9P3Q6U7_9MYCO|nr:MULTISPECIES: lysophospholipid acyltransferase family protein [Mycobacterium]BDB39714.1 hypothetical protein IWGMT90018_01600 [Mycobacterium kiyosense]BDE11570.1 hypothetical protein MKCMC460_04300 [Mycobacterium sp. 20KCMC460]GLB82346.1 hypothetical protein SRL2020028_16020 [Mycobacterium kiyosense]GLB88947.1 hypothetical protein SRL2020130_17640 [Mycobacterium kiyosense]GLB95561.1 hypothetical protein SRL2020226_23370 [Mycobacterium kiyosense]
MPEPARPQRVSLLGRQLTVLVSTFYRLLPGRLSDAAAAVTARFLYWKGHALHSQVLQDFRDNVDPTAQLSSRKWHPVRAMYRAVVRNAADGIWFVTASHTAVLRRFRLTDIGPIANALEVGRQSGVGVIVAFPHLGSYAALPVVLAINGVPTTVVANRQPGLMQWVIDRGAHKAGLELVAVDREKGASITAELEAAIRRGRVVVIAGDYFRSRDEASKGVEVNLAGTRRTVGAGPALLALRTGAPIVPGTVLQDGSRREPVLGQPIFAGGPIGRDDPRLGDLVQVTSQRIADAMAQFIKRAPDQWVMPGGLVSNSMGRRPHRPAA